MDAQAPRKEEAFQLEDVGPVRASSSPDAPPTSRTIGEFALARIRQLVQELAEREPAARKGDDIESLHQMRVATRQLRAMLSLFRRYLPGPVNRLRSRVRRLGRALGEVRDIDVQLADLLAAASHWKEEDLARLEPLRAALHDARNRARRRMLRWLDSPSAERLRVNLARLVEWPKERPSRASQAPTAVVAPELVRKRYRRFRQAADLIGPDSAAAEYHAVRIQAKRTRYALDTFAGLYGEPARALMRTMAKLQDLLGEQQDAITAAERLVSLAHRRRRLLPRTTVFLMGRIAERAERISVHSRQRYEEAYNKTRGRRWKALRKAMTTEEDAYLENRKKKATRPPVSKGASKAVRPLRARRSQPPRLRAVAPKE